MRIPQASENPYEPTPVTLAQRRAARARELDPWGERRRLRASLPARHIPRHVYVVGCDVGLIKIGIAFDVELRLAQLAAASPVSLRLLGWIDRGGRSLERTLHRIFSGRRSHGEWFDVHPHEVEFHAAALGHPMRRVP